jgi:hypothetical protein
VPKNPLDELALGLSSVLRTLTASEKLWSTRLQEMRSAQSHQIRPVAMPPTPSGQLNSTSRVSAQRLLVTPEPIAFVPDVAFPPDRTVDPHVFDTAPALDAQWPTASGSEVVESAGGRRDYDYFAELDEKLSELQKRGVGPRGA